MADVVLVDAPCSSTGVLRRRPSQRFKLKRDEIINKFPTLHGTLLKNGSELVKVGGSLVYLFTQHALFDVTRMKMLLEDLNAVLALMINVSVGTSMVKTMA
jgi:hypothetical protein